MYRDNELMIRSITEKDLMDIWELVYKEEAPEWKKWDAPYYPHTTKSYEEFMKETDHWVGQESRWAIEVNGHFIGMVFLREEWENEK